MSCPRGEIQDDVYGFLGPDESRRVREHQTTCASCRTATERLGRERQLLLQAAELLIQESPRNRRRFPWIWTGAAAAVMCAGTLWIALGNLRWPLPRNPERWLVTPLNDSGQDRSAGDVISRTRAHRAYRGSFELVIRVGRAREPVVYRGEWLWIRPGILYLNLSGSDGTRRRLIRVGDSAWLYHELAGEWRTAADLGVSKAGRGAENPDDVLRLLARHVPNAQGDIQLRLPDRELLGPEFDHVQIRARAVGGRIESYEITAENTSAGVQWTYGIRFLAFDGDEKWEFRNKGVVLPIPELIEKEIRDARRRSQ